MSDQNGLTGFQTILVIHTNYKTTHPIHVSIHGTFTTPKLHLADKPEK